MLWFTLVCHVDANEVKKALVMSDVPLGDSSTDEMREEEEHANQLTMSANHSPAGEQHANQLTASTNDIVVPRSGHPDDSGISTSDSPDKEQYENERSKLTSMNVMSRSSMQGELKKRLSTKDRPAPQPPVKQDSCDKPVPVERRKKEEGEIERKTSVKDRSQSPVERNRKASFKESIERKLSARKTPDESGKGTCCFGNQAVLVWQKYTLHLSAC